MADKIDKYSKPQYSLKEAEEFCKKSLKKIKEYFRENDWADEFEKIKVACEYRRKIAEKCSKWKALR